jgi:hypothetical protein
MTGNEYPQQDGLSSPLRERNALVGISLMALGTKTPILVMFLCAGKGAYWFEWQKEVNRRLYFLSTSLVVFDIIALIIGIAVLYKRN